RSLAAHPEDACRIDRHLAEQPLAGHVIVAAGVIGRTGALVAEVDVPRRPVDALPPRGGGEQLVQPSWRAPAGEGYPEGIRSGASARAALGDPLRGHGGDGGLVLADLDPAAKAGAHSCAARCTAAR